MERFARPGDFCPNPFCTEYGKWQDGESQTNIRKFGKTRRGVQRYQCRTCQQTFTETTGTIFYGKHTSEHEILETLALIAEGSRISSLSRVKGFKEDTILSWLRQARAHLEEIEEILLKDYHVTRGQLDAMWGFVGNKGEKKLPGNG
jgi:transposase-like protein